MTIGPENSEQSFVSTDIVLPEDDSDLREILTDRLQRITEALNMKDIGQYYDVATISGQIWFDPTDVAETREGERIVINFGALPNAAVKTVAHNITVDANTRFTRIYGTANDPSTEFIPLPFVDMSGGAAHIELSVDSTNVSVTTTADYTAFTETFIILEWIQNN